MAIPENRKIPAEQLSGIEAIIDTRVLPANPDQIINLNGLATIASVYRRPDNSVIDFRTSGQRLDDTNPLYDAFTIPDTYLLKTNLLNKWDIFFSCATVPAIISSPPTWLTVTGEILTGYANLNRIKFELDQVYNAVDDIFELKVICNITQAEGANADPNAPSDLLGAGFATLHDEIQLGIEIVDIAGGNDGSIENPLDTSIVSTDRGDSVRYAVAALDVDKSYVTFPTTSFFENLGTEWTIMLGFNTASQSSRDFLSTYNNVISLRGIKIMAVNEVNNRIEVFVNQGEEDVLNDHRIRANATGYITLSSIQYYAVTMENHESDPLLSRVKIWKLDGGSFVNGGEVTAGKEMKRLSVGNTNGLYINSRRSSTPSPRQDTSYTLASIHPSVLTPAQMLTFLDTVRPLI